MLIRTILLINIFLFVFSGKFVTNPNSPGGEKYAAYADNFNFDFSRQLNLAVYNALQAKGDSVFTNISLYDQNIDLPGTALGSKQVP